MTRRSVPVVVVAVLSLAASVSAQFGSFEIASVKPSNPNPTGPIGAVVPAFGRLTAANATLRRLVYAAYQLQPFQVVGGPSWQNTNRFDITAKAIDGLGTTDQILELLKTLLADRFKLKVHTETREIPIYALVVKRRSFGLRSSAAVCPDLDVQQQQRFRALANGGLSQPKPGDTSPCAIDLRPSTSAPGSIAIQATGQTMGNLALALTQLMGRLVVDKTGLTGLYDFNLTVDLQTLARLAADLGDDARPLPPASPETPALITQLQEDLGLTLDSQRGPGEILVIDGAELPMPD